MNGLLKKICVFLRCRERAAIVVAAIFMVGIVLTSHVVTISAFSGYNLRYPVDASDPVDLGLHYIRFDGSYDNISIESTGHAITYSSDSGGRPAYVYAAGLYVYYNNPYWYVAIPADEAVPRLTARDTYTVTVPNNLINNSGDYWEGFGDWHIKVPDPFGDAYYRPENGSTVQPSDLVDDDVLVYYPDIGANGFFNVSDTYPPAAGLGVCDEPDTVIDLTNYLSEIVYNTVAVNDVGQIVNIEQSVLDEFIDGIYGSATDGVFSECIEFTFSEGSMISSDVIGSYENGPRYQLQFLKFDGFVGNGGVVNAGTDGRYTFEFVFNQAVAKYPNQGPDLDTSVRLYDESSNLIETMVVNSGDVVTGNSTRDSDPEVNNALFVTFGTVLTPGATYSVVLGKDVVETVNGAERVRTDMSLSTYEITVAYDDNHPIVIGRSIPIGSDDVATTTQNASFTFDEPVFLSNSETVYRISNGSATSTVTANSVGQYDSVSGTLHTINIANIVNQAFSTTTGLAAGTTYTLEVPQGAVHDDQGNAILEVAEYFIFTTVDNFEEPTPEVNPVEEVDPVEENDSRPPSSRRARQGAVGGGAVVDGSPSASLGAGSDASVDGGTVSIFRDLFYGVTGTDVLELQRALNQLGFTVSETGAGSVGQETQYFGTSTQAAVTRFQINFGIFPSLGYFGPVTRALLGLILGQ